MLRLALWHQHCLVVACAVLLLLCLVTVALVHRACDCVFARSSLTMHRARCDCSTAVASHSWFPLTRCWLAAVWTSVLLVIVCALTVWLCWLAGVWRLDDGIGGWFLVETNYDHWGPVGAHDNRREIILQTMNATGIS